MRKAGFGILITPENPNPQGFSTFAIDNGAWSAFQRGIPWSPDKWVPLIERLGRDAIWAVAPDIVMGGSASLDRSLSWLPWMAERCSRVLIAVQDGMTDQELAPYLSDRVGIFVGGSTEWKESSLPMWGALKRRVGCWLHVGRVNTARRIRLCAMSGADSFDGTAATRFAKAAAPIGRAARQGALLLYANPKTFRAPPAVAAAAREGLRLRASMPPSRRGGTAVGVRRAVQLANRQPVSLDTLRRIRSYLLRHAVDARSPRWGIDSRGWIAWLLWGGAEALQWATEELRRMGERC